MTIQSHEELPVRSSRSQRQWKNLLIDRPLQLRYALISFLLSACLCGILGALVIWQSRQATDFFSSARARTTELFRHQREDTRKLLDRMRQDARLDLERLLKSTSDMIAIQLKDKDPDVREAASVARKEFERNDRVRVARRKAEDQALLMQQRREDREYVAQRQRQDQLDQARRVRDERILLGLLIFFCLVVTVLISLFNIRMTHRIAGPLFKIGRYFDELREGHISELEGLRKGDQLHEFFARFRAMHDAIKGRTEEELALLEAISAQVQAKKEMSATTLASLQTWIAQKRAALDGHK